MSKAYKGSKSDNSILGNSLRTVKASERLLKTLRSHVKRNKLTESQAKEYLKKKGYGEVSYKKGGFGLFGNTSNSIIVEPTFEKRKSGRAVNKVKKYSPNLFGQEDGNIGRYVIDHELGHYRSAKDPKSYNRKFQFNAYNPKEENNPLIYKNMDDRMRTLYKAEQEAWIEGRKIAYGTEGRHKETKEEKT